DGDGGDEEQHEIRGEGDVVAGGGEDHGHQGETDQREGPSDELPRTAGCSMAAPGGWSGRRPRAAPVVPLGDYVDVEAMRLAHNLAHDRAADELLPTAAATGAEDDLGGLLAPGELDE